MKVGRILSKSIPGVEAIDIELLLIKVLGISRASLKAYPERELNHEEFEQFDSLLKKRILGEPVAYLIGHKEFWSLDFIVTPDVLIPRADTELLVEVVLENMEDRKNLRVLDLGTGSGAIALSLAHERPDISVIATDISAESIHIAKLNAKNLQITNIEFALGGWYEALDANIRFDIIVSNPPYIAQFDPHLSQGDLRFEPSRALVSGINGMDALKHIIANAPNYLEKDGMIFLEHGYDQAQLVTNELAKAGFTNITSFKDLAGIPRVTVGNI